MGRPMHGRPHPPTVVIEPSRCKPVGRRRVELVERKGIGHPDTICDAVQEAISVALCRAYQEEFGRILHHNIDKSLLVAGSSTPRPGGGRVTAPMRMVIGDRATTVCGNRRIDVDAVVRATVGEWFRKHLRFVDPTVHLVLQNELKPGSAQLGDIFDREVMGANDTSAAVGYAPLSETEALVLAAERFLNSADFKKRYPETGEDVKVMACRRDRHLTLTVATAFVDRFIPDNRTYFSRKAEIKSVLEAHLAERLKTIDTVTVDLNCLDDPARGDAGMYLTVLGTSAEGADGGQVGRGNKVNGLIPLNRPVGTEAAAGKNPTSHVGKIYTLFTHRLAGEIHARVPGVEEVYVWLCSQIGRPIDQPLIASVALSLAAGTTVKAVSTDIEALVRQELDDIHAFTQALAEGAFPVC
ncbi:methionine adenosyltransferase [Desulfococcus multivorans]|uniref:S-adenosylmethionine synthetase (MAT) n=3 Tax=Desulfococcus TaxID=896 RepID=S7VBI1_DESML|nr:methionine adenosyltransferase [Desulfococcus multivorans]AQV02825.2 S-adenosylmethionine synthetase [Desulfococcus multivorans]EPR41808.1 S-adenosylmethionine synthetase (MAT) [Desulfococcus multivorans DSM 2059]SJZ87552.1 methionine adenosyltransferase [Desulfococcus multivorans DSM 2059]